MECFSDKLFVDISLLKLSYDIFVTFCIVCFGGNITDKVKTKIEYKTTCLKHNKSNKIHFYIF